MTFLGLKSIIKFKPVIVCMCFPASERDIDAMIDDGARSLSEIGERCGAGTGCGSCVGELRERLATKGANGCSRDCPSDLVSLSSRPK
nr:(2Fe-2S)-binding protein [Kofleriaceae bacterium]